MQFFLHNQTSFKIFFKIYYAYKMVFEDISAIFIILSKNKLADDDTAFINECLEEGEFFKSGEGIDSANIIDVFTISGDKEIVIGLEETGDPNIKSMLILETAKLAEMNLEIEKEPSKLLN